jgi:hypothetical protein
MASHYARGLVTTLRDVGGVLGQPLDTFFGLSQFHGRGSWLVCEVALSSLNCIMRAALHLEAGPIRCVRCLKSLLVIGQKVQIGPNPFTPRGCTDLVV